MIFFNYIFIIFHRPNFQLESITISCTSSALQTHLGFGSERKHCDEPACV